MIFKKQMEARREFLLDVRYFDTVKSDPQPLGRQAKTLDFHELVLSKQQFNAFIRTHYAQFSQPHLLQKQLVNLALDDDSLAQLKEVTAPKLHLYLTKILE